MASSYVGGSVTAKVELDSSKFDSALQKLTERVKNFQAQLNQTHADNLAKQVADLENKLSTTDSTVADLTSQIEGLTSVQNKLGDTVKTTITVLDDFSKKSKNSTDNGKKAVQEYLNEWSKATTNIKRDSAEINNAISKFREECSNLPKDMAFTDKLSKREELIIKVVLETLLDNN